MKMLLAATVLLVGCHTTTRTGPDFSAVRETWNTIAILPPDVTALEKVNGAYRENPDLAREIGEELAALLPERVADLELELREAQWTAPQADRIHDDFRGAVDELYADALVVHVVEAKGVRAELSSARPAALAPVEADCYLHVWFVSVLNVADDFVRLPKDDLPPHFDMARSDRRYDAVVAALIDAESGEVLWSNRVDESTDELKRPEVAELLATALEPYPGMNYIYQDSGYGYGGYYYGATYYDGGGYTPPPVRVPNVRTAPVRVRSR